VSSRPPTGFPDTSEPDAHPPTDQTPRLGRLTPEERQAAVLAPGESWTEWLYGTAFKWWLGLALLIIDSWIVAGWIEVGGWYDLAGSIVLAIYLEFLLYQYLWHSYRPELRGKFRPTWHAPFEVGRWAPERKDALAGRIEPSGPDPRQFL
jgi:hypothetical protein